MRGKKAKAIRFEVYGEETYRQRQYFRINKTGQIIADPKRRLYQALKRNS